jgi:hypothetical protein
MGIRNAGDKSDGGHGIRVSPHQSFAGFQSPLAATNYRLSAIGYRLSAIGYRLSAIGYRLFDEVAPRRDPRIID